MIRIILENKIIMPFNTDKPGRKCEEFFGNVGNVSAHDYQKFEKGKDAIIKWMTCDEYINRCINDIFDSSYEAVVTNAVDMFKVREYANNMRNGEIFPLPSLNYVYHQQEGRHRMLAFKLVNGSEAKAPVLVILPTEDNVSIEEIEFYCRQKWGDYWEDFYDSMIKRYLGISTQEDEEDNLDISNDEDEEVDNLDISDEDLESILQYLSDKYQDIQLKKFRII